MRRGTATLVVGGLAAVVAAGAVAAGGAPSYTGRWLRPKLEVQNGERETYSLLQRGNRVTGKHSSQGAFIDVGCDTGKGGTIKGIVRGRKLEAAITWPRSRGTLYLEISANGKRVQGQAGVFHGQCTGSWIPFNATRIRS